MGKPPDIKITVPTELVKVAYQAGLKDGLLFGFLAGVALVAVLLAIWKPWHYRPLWLTVWEKLKEWLS